MAADGAQDRTGCSHLPEPASLVAADEGTAKVLAALTAEVARVSASQEQVADSSVLGPRLGLSLDTGESPADCVDASAEESAAAEGEGSRTLSDFLVEDFSTPEQLDAGATELNEYWMQEVDGSVAWPDKSEPVAACPPPEVEEAPVTVVDTAAATEAPVAATAASSGTDSSPSDSIAAPIAEETAGSIQEESSKPVIERILEGLNRPDRTLPPTGPRASGEEDRMRRAELIRKAMSERTGSGTLEGIGKSGLSPRLSRLTWKPGDPYAGWSRRYRFRWHAMALTAFSIVGVGYLTLRVLVLVGVI